MFWLSVYSFFSIYSVLCFFLLKQIFAREKIITNQAPSKLEQASDFGMSSDSLGVSKELMNLAAWLNVLELSKQQEIMLGRFNQESLLRILYSWQTYSEEVKKSTGKNVRLDWAGLKPKLCHGTVSWAYCCHQKCGHWALLLCWPGCPAWPAAAALLLIYLPLLPWVLGSSR